MKPRVQDIEEKNDYAGYELDPTIIEGSQIDNKGIKIIYKNKSIKSICAFENFFMNYLIIFHRP